MATTLSPLQTQLHSSPPADQHPLFLRKDLSQHSTSTFPDPNKVARRSSLNRYSWSSVSNTSPVSAPSPTTPDNATSPSRKFRLPVRVSTDLTSFASSDSSPQSRRRSLSLASDSKAIDNKRRSKALYLQQLQEDKVADPKKSPSKESPPPPAYEKAAVSSDKKPASSPAPPPAPAPAPTPKVKEEPPPSYEKPVPPPPEKPEVRQEAAAPRQVPHNPAKMSSTASSPEQKGSMTAAPAAARGMDFSMSNGDNKLTAQHGALPMPSLSGKPNGPIGNLLRGPVDDQGNLKAAALTVGIKLDLEAEVHLTARVRGDILVGLY